MFKKLVMKNKPYFLVFITIFLIMLICTIYETNFFNNLYIYISDFEYRNNVMKTTNNYDFFSCLSNLLSKTWSSVEWNFDYIVIWGTNIFQLFLPFLSIIGSLYYFNNIKKFGIKSILLVSIKISFSIFLAYLLFYFLSIIICNGNYSSYITRTLFLDIFGESFYFNHIYIYYILDGFVRFFIMTYIYIASGILLSFKFKNKIWFYYYIINFYFCLSILATILANLFGQPFIYLNPTTIMISGNYNDISTPLIIIINLLLLLISLYIFNRIGKKENYEK